MATKDSLLKQMQNRTLRIARVHFLYAFALIASVIVYDSWQLIAPQDVLNRWILVAALLVATTLVWYAVKVSDKARTYAAGTYTLILADILVAGFLVYGERGMASRAVMLFAIPLLVAATLRRSSALFATASLSIAAYTFAAVRYFVVNFNEGYKIELYANLAFYSFMLFVFAWLLSILINDQP